MKTNDYIEAMRQIMDCYTKAVEIEGHKYIIMDGFYSGGIIHASSCECMNK